MAVLLLTLIENLKSKEYDSAFVFPFDKFDNKTVRLQEINEPNEVFKTAKSKYIPVSAYNIIKALEENKKISYYCCYSMCYSRDI